ncbi:MAG: hypothetical protein JSV17_13135 [Candidatus Aminicenantes bacterium]|nr:MAG: hypothetical protein JSV17_13135 [Candidatus Aminicenantes bacterium]
MTRKDFLKTACGGALGALFFMSFNSCKSPASPNASDDANQKTFTSTSNSGHTHRITINRSDIENPPAAGITRQTSSASGHTHNFTMSQAQLQSVNSGNSVDITDSVSSGHSHQYTIEKWF